MQTAENAGNGKKTGAADIGERGTLARANLKKSARRNLPLSTCILW